MGASPDQGMSELDKAAEAALMARTSGSPLPSLLMSMECTCGEHLNFDVTLHQEKLGAPDQCCV